MTTHVAMRFGPLVIAAWLVPGLLIASRVPDRWGGPAATYLQPAVLVAVAALGAGAWVGSAWALARVQGRALDRALRLDAATYVGLLLALPALAGVAPAGVSLLVGALGCMVAKALLWLRPSWTVGDGLPFLGLGMVALLFAVPNVFSARGLLPTLSESLSGRDRSYDDKMTEKWPELYPLMRFVGANTLSDSTIELPPHVVATAESPMGNAALCYYFLRPRTLVQGPPGLGRSAFSDAYTVVAYGRFQPGTEDRAVWPAELPADRPFLPMPQELTILLDQVVGTGPQGEFLRLDFEGGGDTSLRRLATDTQSTLLEHRILDQGHVGRRSESLDIRYESGSVDEWAVDVGEDLGPGRSLSALVRPSAQGTVRLFADVGLPMGTTLRLYSEPNSLERWWDILRIPNLSETAAAGSDGGLGAEDRARLLRLGFQVLPHLERWGLVMPSGSR